MKDGTVPVGRLTSTIVSVLAVALLLSLAGLVILGLAGGDTTARDTLIHVAETVIGVFVGIAAGRLAGDD